MQTLQKTKPEGKDSMYASRASDVTNFAVATQEAQASSLSTLIPTFTNFLTGKSVDVSSAMKKVDVESAIKDGPK